MHTTPNPFSGAPFLPFTESDPTIVRLEALADRLYAAGKHVVAWTIRGNIDGLLGQPDVSDECPEDWSVAYRTARTEALELRGGVK